MDFGLTGKVAIVTGASRGIGAATALALVREGAAVTLTSRKQAALDEVATQIREQVPDGRVLAKASHAADSDGAEAVVAATSPYYGPMAGLDKSRADKTVDVNMWGPIMWTQQAVKAGLGSGGSGSGAVVNIASIGGLATEPGIGWYNATKAALIHLTRQLAVELGPDVRVNAVAPGVVRTHLAKALWEPFETQLAQALPLGRIGEPDDIADAVVFLAGSSSRWVTGQTLVVDGGTLVRQSIG
jgi:NAD(P)-dependent dehydrogenase (short-subunit alcohol dehydrogenase family)